MDATSLLLQDHRKVGSVFNEYRAATTPETRTACVDRIVMVLSIHAGIEESLHERQEVKKILAELAFTKNGGSAAA
jgi:hypothetical protein